MAERMTRVQLASRLQCSVESIRLWMRDLGFPGPVDASHPRVWDWAAVEAWVRQNCPERLPGGLPR